MILTTKGLAASLFQQGAKVSYLGKMANNHFCDKYYKDLNYREGTVVFAVLVSQRMGTLNKETSILTPASALILHTLESSCLKQFGR